MPPRRQANLRLWLVAGALLGAAIACGGEEFTNFNEVDRLRVVGMRADPPWLVATSSDASSFPSATVSALIGQAPGTSTAAAQIEWSWCPLRAGQSGDEGVEPFGCVFGPNQINEMLGLPPPDPADAPENEFPIEGNRLEVPVPPSVVADICNQLSMVELPEFVSLPNCDDGFPISVRIRVRQGAEEVIAFKEVILAFDPETGRNDNPELGDVFIVDPADPNSPMKLDPGVPLELKREVEYEVRVGLDPFDAQPVPLVEGAMLDAPFVDPATCDNEVMPGVEPPPRAREDLIVTWFVQGGETEYTRTGWLADECASEADFEDARRNRWTTPKVADFEPTEARLFFVLRDGRRGADFTSRVVTLVDEEE